MYPEDDRLDVYPIRIRMKDGSERTCNSNKELPQNDPFTIIEYLVGRIETVMKLAA